MSKKKYAAQPTLPHYSAMEKSFQDIFDSGMLSNFSKYSQQLESTVQDTLQVERALTMPNCTSAMMLACRALGLTGEVILPSFTFSATGHALTWNNLQPVFADIDRNTFNIDPADVMRKITPQTSAIIAVNIFGNPADIETLETIAKQYDLKLIFDSAHGLGSTYRNKYLGSFGDLECFSLSGTKLISSGEGGLITSNNTPLMNNISIGRNCGSDSGDNTEYAGLNGKMSEFHAAIALEILPSLGHFAARRNAIAAHYKTLLSETPGISFQEISKNCTSSYKDFAIIVNPEQFCCDRDMLIEKLNETEIYPEQYFSTPLHKMDGCSQTSSAELPNTDHVANNIVCLPIYTHMTIETIETICGTIHSTWEANTLINT